MEAIRALLSLPASACLHVGTHWHLNGQRAIVDKASFDALVGAAGTETHVTLVFPATKETPVIEYHVLTTTIARVRAAPVKRVHLKKDDAEKKRAHVLALTGADTPRRVSTVTFELPWTRIDRAVGDLTVDAVRARLATSIQATAEMRVWALSNILSEKEALCRRLLAQYATAAVGVCDTLFAAAVLPRTRAATLPVTKILGNAAAADPSVMYAWAHADKAPSVREWLLAGETLARLFVKTLPGDVDLDGPLAAHRAFFGASGRVPPTALAWMADARPNPADLLNPLASAADVAPHVFKHVRADVARWCVCHAPAEPALDDQMDFVTAPFVAAWNATLTTVMGCAHSDPNAVIAWGSLALHMAQFSGLPVLLAGATVAAKRKLEEDAAVEEQRLARYKALGFWMWPKHGKDEVPRMAAVNANSHARLSALLLNSDAHVPPCVRSVLARGRALHHLTYKDRHYLAGWLVALQPRSLPPTRDAVTFMAHFALGGDAATREERQTFSHLVDTLVDVVRTRDGKKPAGVGVSCSAVIAQTLNPSDPLRHACKCPYAALRSVYTPEENPKRAGQPNIEPCVRACAAACADTRTPRAFHPMHRVLWAKEMKRDALLDW